MFEKLGYYASYDYKKPKVDFAFYKKYSEQMIVFNVRDKIIEIIEGGITLEELQAINKQVEELGWNKGSENNEVEIIEDTPKKIEKINNTRIMQTMGLDLKVHQEEIPKEVSIEEITNKINEIIDKMNGE